MRRKGPFHGRGPPPVAPALTACSRCSPAGTRAGAATEAPSGAAGALLRLVNAANPVVFVLAMFHLLSEPMP